MVKKILAHRIDNSTRHLRTAGSVKISHGMAIVHAFERRKMRTNFVYRDRLAGLWFHKQKDVSIDSCNK